MTRRHKEQCLHPPGQINTAKKRVAEIDVEGMQRAKRLGSGYRPLVEKEETKNPEENEVEPERAETEEDTTILRVDKLSIVDRYKFNTEGPGESQLRRNLATGEPAGGEKTETQPRRLHTCWTGCR